MSLRRLPMALALVAMAGGAVSASASGSHGGGSAPAPPPPPAAHSSGGGSHSASAPSRGYSPNTSVNTRGNMPNTRANMPNTRANVPNVRGIQPVVPRLNRAGAMPTGAAARTPKGAAEIAKAHEFRWACEGAGGVYYYTYGGPCPDLPLSAPGLKQTETQNVGSRAFQNGTEYATDPWTVGLGPNAGRPREDELPILTKRSDMVAPYAVILRDGMALASVERPRQSGNMIIARDRGGNLYSIRASEVDMGATRPQAPAAAAH